VGVRDFEMSLSKHLFDHLAQVIPNSNIMRSFSVVSDLQLGSLPPMFTLLM
jgi:hypothetical protein